MAGPEDSKAAAKLNPTSLKKKPMDDDEDDEVQTAGPAPKQTLLSTGLSRGIVIAAFLTAISILAGDLYGGRYELVPAPNSTNGFMYKIDKLTGAVQFCAPTQCTEIRTRKSTPSN